MKPINLLSLLNAHNDLLPDVFLAYLANYNVEKTKDDELEDMKAFVDELRACSKRPHNFDGFYAGFKIPQISKQFDLLRFGDDSVINIELKQNSTKEKMHKQLVRNNYYLKFVKKRVFCFVFRHYDKKLFWLENGVLEEIDFPSLVSILGDQVLQDSEDINKLFEPSNYLVSPFNSTEKFVGNEYFLTGHQEDIKEDILKLSHACFVSIEGAAGTGKTLLTYDIAKQYRNSGSNVLIIHCGSLNQGHNMLRDHYGWSIISIKDYAGYNLATYDLVILDEAQRVRKHQLNDILAKLKQTAIRCIFSYDAEQCLSKDEMTSDIPKYIEAQVSPKVFKLTKKIRTNKEIAAFITNLFDLSKTNASQKYSNIDVQYFSNVDDVKRYMTVLREKGWKTINYTPSQYDNYPYDRYHIYGEDSAHAVIGQEYDKVVVVLDEYFKYNANGKLSIHSFGKSPVYNVPKMLFQMVTRARKELRIIIIGNRDVLIKCLSILG